MNIRIRYEPTCTWELDGGSFWCTHDEIEVVDYTYTSMSWDGPVEHESQGYACVECGEPLEGSPDADRAEMLAEAQLMEMLGK